jgi:hypothetical protein
MFLRAVFSWRFDNVKGSLNMATRTATLRLNSKDNPTLLRVALPPKITEGELAKLTDHIVQNAVHVEL